MTSLHRQDLKPKISRRLRRVKSTLPRSGMPSLSGSIRLERTSHSLKDTLHPKSSWYSQGSQRDGSVIEPDEYFISMLKSWHKRSDGIQLDSDGVPTTYSTDKGSVLSEEYVIQIGQELHEAQDNVVKAKKKLQHFSKLHLRALRSKDFDKAPTRSPDELFEAYDREVLGDSNTATQHQEDPADALVRATRHHWELMAEVEAKMRTWQRTVDEWEERVVQLNAELLCFSLDTNAICEEAEGCPCGCRHETAPAPVEVDRRGHRGRQGSTSTRRPYYERDGGSSSRSSSRSSSKSGYYSTSYKW